MNYWLLKTEPDVYSIDDLARDRKTPWTGVRNYQARNYMRDSMKLGDLVVIYHSNTEPPGVVGTASVSSQAHADATALDKKSDYFDAKASKENPIWMCVDIKFEKKFTNTLSLDKIRANPRLKSLQILQRGNRLSVTPLKKEEFDELCLQATAKH